jgi:hypothetical protein
MKMRKRPLSWRVGLPIGAGVVALLGIVIVRADSITANDSATAKQQYVALLQQGYAQDQDGVPAPKDVAGSVPPSLPACSPEPLPSAGINDGAVQFGAGSYETFITSNQWTGPVAASTSSAYVVYAGMTGESAATADVPAIEVDIRTLSPDGCTVTTAQVGTFTEPKAVNKFTITSVQGVWVFLETPNGVPFYFNLDTDQFSTTPPAI